MFERIIQFSIRNKPIIAFLVFVLIGAGIYSLTRIPIDAVPDITNNQVQIVTTSPSLSPQEVEKFITYPLEVTMANIKDVVEIRSVSRYGLSVVTVVFRERVPILDARQLVNEQIQMARSDIPSELGVPEMLPITTGLGEVFQYTLEVEPGYEGKYDITELRTIQDWIVKRQLSGIPGIVEISSFGGLLKQYEVAIDPIKLKAHDLTITDVFNALEHNNENTGGSYIEKHANAFYIRAEGLAESLSDIENVVITTQKGVPILIRNVAEVRIGAAPRFGAMTRNGKGEAVGGITLMLKGANSSEVISQVKERVEQVQKALPEGIHIVPYLDRSELVSKTIGTVAENLVLGGLIVIFILVLLLGNIRSGIIVASVIPLSLLFAFIMMNIFGVSANLMSLGAIDFGIVIDGAVIIIENIVHQIYLHHKGKILSQEQMDEVVHQSSTSIYQSAAFGVFIILIVFVPIMTLTGIEGKTFIPMAQTFSFAILGAFFLSITYVPMMAASFMNKKITLKTTLSDRFIHFLKLSYHPVLRFSLTFKYAILGTTLLVFAGSIWIFSRLGGEFLPTLEEGDLAMQMTIPPGSSLSQSIHSSTQAEKILLDNFPEVEQVVSKIGTAEVPTDPMAIEDADIMIILKDKKEWTSATTREELIAKMKDKLSDITAASFEFTQPIQLRFNELMTGVKTDIAVKIFGEDLDELFDRANEAADLISGLPGAADIKVEQITGLPQYVIRYDRDQIAQYGLNITDLNTIIRTAFAGENAGVIFEGERRFDLVVRMDSAHRSQLNLDQLYVRLPGGSQIPLTEVASMKYEEGPMQISRDETRRRVTIGINVRNRDIQSLVNEINEVLTRNLSLKPGYYITYGGQFENFQNAYKRLKVAVPIALLLILILLFFTFNSIKYALLIFTAVPLSAVGGVIALWIRGMPFSISAGVGFIALFGVAVLNGIVLISYYNQLQARGVKNINYIIVKGASSRLRPVMMTATTDILGFLPMAVSASAGAEVQRPLATVVIGGLITSTMLTLIILPILYQLINRDWKFRLPRMRKEALLGILLLVSPVLFAQEQESVQVGEKEAVQSILSRHPLAANADLMVRAAQAGRSSMINFQPLEVIYEKGQINSALVDQYLGVTQDLGSPLVHVMRAQETNREIELKETEGEILQHRLEREARLAYWEWIYRIRRSELLAEQARDMETFLELARKRVQQGEDAPLESALAASRESDARNRALAAQDEAELARQNLIRTCFLEGSILPADSLVRPLPDPIPENGDPLLMKNYYLKQYELDHAGYGKEKAGWFPSLSVGYFNQEIDQVKGFNGWSVGLSFPLWFFPQQARVKQARIRQEMSWNEYLYQGSRLDGELQAQKQAIRRYARQVDGYETSSLKQAALLEIASNNQWKGGMIDYVEYLQARETILSIRLGYLDALYQYNQAVIEYEFLSK